MLLVSRLLYFKIEANDLNFYFCHCSDRNTALSYAQSKGLMYTADGRVLTQTEEQYSNVCYPKRNDKYVHGYISHVSREKH